MTHLTEDEVLARLQAAIAQYPSRSAFANARRVWQPIVCDVMNGKYPSGFPPSLLAAIGVRKETVYVLVEDAKERAA